MLSRKLIFLACVILTIGLFIEGAFILYGTNAAAPRERFYSRGEQLGRFVLDAGEQEYTDDKRMPVNALILGLDNDEIRTDVILLANFNPDDGQLNLLSIPRDTRVVLNGTGRKINSLYSRGEEALAAQKIEELTGLPIHYYMTLDFEGFRKIIDALGGVELNIPFNMNYDDPAQKLHIHLKKGVQVLDGEKAEEFVRYRKGNISNTGFTYDDNDRMKAQQDLIKSVVAQKLNIRYISRADEIFEILKKYMRTNVQISDVDYYLDSLMKLRYDKIGTYILPGDSVYRSRIWYFICDDAAARKLIDEKFYK